MSNGNYDNTTTTKTKTMLRSASEVLSPTLQAINSSFPSSSNFHASNSTFNTTQNGKVSEKYEKMYNTRKEVLSKHMEKLMDVNHEYFKKTRNQVFQSCGGPKELSLDYKKGAESLYQSDFKKHQYYKPVPRVGSDFFSGFNTQQPMELSTINRTDYLGQKGARRGLEKKDEVSPFLPFSGDSSYRNAFANWGANPVSIITPTAIPTVIKELPFMGKSMYASTFTGKFAEQEVENERIKNVTRRGQFKSPINPDFPFLPNTTSGQTYQEKRSTTKSCRINVKADGPLPPYAGQYSTISKKDYTPKKAEMSYL